MFYATNAIDARLRFSVVASTDLVCLVGHVGENVS